MSDVTRILGQIESGDPKAAEELLPLVYEELRRLAAQRMAQEKPGQTLQATALVHEAYVRLVDSEQERRWSGRRHFYCAASEAMQRILVERARRKHSVKQGGHAQRVPLDEVVWTLPEPDVDLLALHDALTRLEETEPEKAQLVRLRFFAGLSMEEAAETLGVSRTTAKRYWIYARAWLHRQVNAS
jgi:RNA polymerase sigma factor (TIGR02999 family)